MKTQSADVSRDNLRGAWNGAEFLVESALRWKTFLTRTVGLGAVLRRGPCVISLAVHQVLSAAQGKPFPGSVAHSLPPSSGSTAAVALPVRSTRALNFILMAHEKALPYQLPSNWS